MSLSLLASVLSSRWPLLLYAAAWTAVLTAFVAVASFSPELAFVSAISRPCRQGEDGAVRVPLDAPSAVFCFPANVFGRSRMDLAVPPVFAAVVVAGSAFAVRAFGLWESDDDEARQ